MTGADRRRAAAERQRRRRQRVEDHQAVYRIVVDGDVINMLTRCHWLADRDSTKPKCVTSALERMLADAAKAG